MSELCRVADPGGVDPGPDTNLEKIPDSDLTSRKTGSRSDLIFYLDGQTGSDQIPGSAA